YYIDEVRQELGKVISDVKYYSRSLRPRSLDQLGLIPTIEALINDIQENMRQTTFHLSCDYNNRLHSSAQSDLYRVVQEATHNTMKYADAKNIETALEKENEHTLHVRIKDDGVGLDTSTEKRGLGLLHMKERISLTDGTIHIASEIGQG